MALPGLFEVNQDSPAASAALLAMRIIAGLTLFVSSGAPKLLHLSALIVKGADPLHVGGLAAPAMIYAAFALGICTLLIVIGLATRYAALFTAISLAATLLLIDHALTLDYLDPGHNSHPEVTFLYLVTYVAMVFTGAGRYSLDGIVSIFFRSAPPASA
jgi:putative oxidoreductase